jgi:hypothetical protein
MAIATEREFNAEMRGKKVAAWFFGGEDRADVAALQRSASPDAFLPQSAFAV